MLPNVKLMCGLIMSKMSVIKQFELVKAERTRATDVPA